MTPTQKIKEIEKEIEEIEEKYTLNPDYDFEIGLRNPVEKWIFNKAKLSVYKEWEAEDKRRINNFLSQGDWNFIINTLTDCGSTLSINIRDRLKSKVFSQEDGE